MIGLGLAWDAGSWIDFSRIAPSLGLFAGAPASHQQAGPLLLACLTAPRARPVRGWRAARSPAGLPVLLSGWIDDRADLAAQLGLSAATCAETLYGAAFERWGDRADSLINGVYATLICLPDGTIRMARSPLGGQSLFYAADRSGAVAASVPRPILAAGWQQCLRQQAVTHAVAQRIDDSDELGFFEGVRSVPDGAISYLSRDGVRTDRWYDLTAVAETRCASDGEYVEAANALLARATGNALGLARQPAISLSGGLDSAIVCDELTRQLPAGTTLRAYSFRPLNGWEGQVVPDRFYDDQPLVEQFLRSHPQVHCQYTDNPGVGFDYRAPDFFLATGSSRPSLILDTINRPVHEAAARDGCDWMFNANSGNLTFSQSAPWACADFLRRGQLGEAWRAARGNRGDTRPMWRRMAALGLLPLFPGRLAEAIRAIVHRNDAEPHPGILRGEAIDPGGLHISGFPRVSSHREWLRALKPWLGLGAESAHGYEQVFGIRVRDVGHYRPLMEFCFGLPTAQLMRGGTDRWLARRMAIGRMPEAQRLNRSYGRQNADWYPRLAPRVAELRRAVERMAEQPEIGPLIDTARALALLDNWPESPPPPDSPEEYLLRFAIPATVLMSQYVDFVTGRNAA